MSGGSAKPKRRKAAGSALRYEHRPGRPSSPIAKMSVGEKVFGCLVLPVFVLLILPLVAIDMNWGHDIWGTLAPAWPGGAYAFAATVGALAPLAFGAWVAPLTRMKWKESKPRSPAWVVASLPGLAACYLVAGVIGTYGRPKRRSNWDSDCFSTGGPCWVHERYPYLWAAGTLATVAVLALLIALFVRYGAKEAENADSPEPVSS
ncbi:hypothetical protein ABZ835_39050 [Streptomyces sp. NPDC047461]|uniref:hypothetical protein n=1 Tax=Streptomyces sp. NPDC047461 TaxID=3155619 RepID=UPI0033C2D265